MTKPAVWFPTVRTNSGSDTFTEQIVNGLNKHGIHAEITWLPHHAEYLPWIVKKPKKPDWANIIHTNSWLHPKFFPKNIPRVTNVHLCIQDPALKPYNSLYQKIYHKFWITPIEQKNILKAASIIAVSNYTAKQVVSFFKVKSVNFIYNGIDTEIFTPIKKTTNEKKFIILFAGNNTKRKGFELLTPIMEKLGPNFELHYTSDRNNSNSYLPKNMKQLPRLNYPLEMAKAYQDADILLLPTRLEGFGLVAAEAMACGLPVIASYNSALPEVVEHNVTGLLCQKDNIDSFVKAIEKLATEVEVLKKMKTAARLKAECEFNLDTMIENYVKVYKDLLV